MPRVLSEAWEPDVGGHGLGFPDELPGLAAVSLYRGKTCEKMAWTLVSFQPPIGAMVVAFPAELGERQHGMLVYHRNSILTFRQ